MAFNRPTLSDLIDQGAAEFESRLTGVLVRIRRSLVGVINRVQAGGLSTLYQYVEWLNNQVWPDKADEDYLADHAARWGIVRVPAAAASGTVTFTGTNNAPIPAGTALLRSDGVQFLTSADVPISGASVSVTVTAADAGQTGNTDQGASLQLASPISGVAATAIAATALSGGADIEDVESWRARILAQIRAKPQGGSVADYLEWALEVPGVTRAWVFPSEAAAGTVTVRFARDNDSSPIPDVNEVATVQAYIDARRPAASTTYVVAPIGVPFSPTIKVVPNTPAIQAAVQAELADLLVRAGSPGGTLLLSDIDEAIKAAPGLTDFQLPSPTASVTYTTGQLPVMGTITWLP